MRFAVSAVNALLLFATLSADAQTRNDGPLAAHMGWMGGLSNIKFVEVELKPGGVVTGRFQKHGAAPAQYTFQLKNDELTTIVRAVHAVRFFDQPETISGMVPDAGETSLSITLGNRNRTLRFGINQELQPLSDEIWKLAHQGIISSELEHGGDAYPAEVAVCPQLVGSKVYSPRGLLEPLKKNILGTTDSQKLEHAFAALTWITSEQEWRDLVSTQASDANFERRVQLLKVLSSPQFYSKIRPTHSTAMLVPLTSALKDALDNQRIDSTNEQAFWQICSFIGMKKYAPARPVLLQAKQKYPNSRTASSAESALQALKSPE